VRKGGKGCLDLADRRDVEYPDLHPHRTGSSPEPPAMSPRRAGSTNTATRTRLGDPSRSLMQGGSSLSQLWPRSQRACRSTAYRETLILRDVQGLFSEVTGVPIGTVMSRLARGRNQVIKTIGRTES
jgi:DNA-directed RNA polymerase specialized sigma24 family protein